MQELTGKCGFVAGGSSGINLEIARNFASAGMRVALFSRSLDKLTAAQQLIEAAGAQCMIFAGDVRDHASLAQASAATAAAFGPIDVVICGAAGNFVCAAETLTTNGFRTVTDIDTWGTFNTASATFPHLRKPGAAIIAISAPQATVPYPMQAHVSAAKAGVDSLVRSLAVEWGPLGVRVLGISPGPIADTEGMSRLAPTPEVQARLAERLLLRRNGTKAEIAQLAAFLASDRASYITGITIACDGGLGLMGPSGLGQAA